MTRKKPIDHLNDAAQAVTLRHLRRRNMLMLEAVISAMLDTDDVFRVAEILKEHADQLVEYF